MKAKSLKSKFVVFISLITLIVLIITSIVTLVLSIGRISDSTMDSLDQAVYIGEANVNAWFEDKERMLQMVRDEMRLFDISQKIEIEDFMSFYMNHYDFMVDVYIGTPDNQMYSGSYWIPDEGYDVREREWYTGAKSVNGIYYTAPYIDAYSGTMVVTVSTPISDKNGMDMGVIGLDLKLDSLVEFVNNQKILDTTGSAFLLDQNHNFITHANSEFLPKISGDSETYTNIQEIDMEAAQDIDYSSLFLDQVRSWDGRSVYLATVNIPANGWTYGFEVPTSDFTPMYMQLVLQWVAIMGAMVVVSLLLSRQITGRLLQPIQTIIEKAHAISQGDIHVSLDVKTGDELESLAKELNRLVASTTEQVGAMQKMADGDFTTKITPKSDKDVLSLAINAVIKQLSKLVIDINNLAEQVAVSSHQVADGAQHLASGATEQAAEVDGVSRSLTSILDVTKESAGNTKQSSARIAEMRDMAHTGTMSMQEMVQAVDEIEKASTGIEKIIKVINDIAFQTNILALNAAVEAARAGEAGKGFAVVADEVRNLAAKSAEATKSTSTLITDSSAKAADGVNIAAQTQKVFEELVEKIDSVDTLIRQVNTSSGEQVTNVEQINGNVGQISQVVQQTSATAQQSAAASEEMSSLAQTLKNMMDQFRTNEE